MDLPVITEYKAKEPIAVIYGIFLVFAFLQVLFAHANFWSFLIALVIYAGAVAVLIRTLALILADFDHVERIYRICTDLYQMLKSRPELSEEKQNLVSRLTAYRTRAKQ